MISGRAAAKPAVLIFAAGYSEAGGSARRARLIATSLAKRGWEVRVVSKTGTLRRFALRRDRGLTVLEIPGFESKRMGAGLFLLVGIAAGLVWSRRSSAIVAIQLASPAMAAATCSLLTARPYIAMTTTSGAFSEAAYVARSSTASLRRRLLSRAALLVAQTDEGAAELEELVGSERVAVVPNPVELVQPPPLTGSRRALFTGRLSEEKDLFRLVEAWKAVVADHPDAILTLAGDGGPFRSVENELRSVVGADPVLSRQVRFTGWVPDVSALLAESDVYVLASTTEGMSNALLEACSWGRVVVASDIPSNRAILSDSYPLLFRTGDTQSLAQALCRAFADESVRQAARAMIAGRVASFSVDVVMASLERVLEGVARQSRR